MRVFLLLISFISILGCTKYKEGECIQNTSDGFIYRITAVHFNEYTLQGWFGDKWGIPVKGSFDTFDSRYVAIACPFSEKTIK